MRVVELGSLCRPMFAHHETFHPRFGWLRKAYEGAILSPDLFSQPNATVELGVGKNMVHAIRYWGLAFKILRTSYDKERPRRPGIIPTVLATTIFRDDGWDPYLEESATLWLLHWQLLSGPCLAPAWWIALNLMSVHQFDEAVLTRAVVEASAAVDGWTSVVPASIKKDVDCLIRMYALHTSGRSGLDDFLDCPFRELGLLEPAPGDARSYRFNLGPKAGLPDEIVTFACLDYLASVSQGASSIGVARLATDLGGPGQAFKLSEPDLFEALRRTARKVPGVRVAEPAGLKQLHVDGPPVSVGREILADYYGSLTGSARAWVDEPAPQSAKVELVSVGAAE